MTGERRRFSVTAPDWGQDHLTSDAIVAYVDSELADRPFSRATRHLQECAECLAQVRAQGQARSALRSAECPSLPSSLLSTLRAIPRDAELPGPPDGLAVSADGRLVSVLRPEAAGAVPAAPVVVARSVSPPPHGRRVPRSIKFGAGAAVSGLALGALAFGVPVTSVPSPAPAGAERGVFNGTLLGGGPGVVEARLRLDPSEQADRITGTAPGGR